MLSSLIALNPFLKPLVDNPWLAANPFFTPLSHAGQGRDPLPDPPSGLPLDALLELAASDARRGSQPGTGSTAQKAAQKLLQVCGQTPWYVLPADEAAVAVGALLQAFKRGQPDYFASHDRGAAGALAQAEHYLDLAQNPASAAAQGTTPARATELAVAHLCSAIPQMRAGRFWYTDAPALGHAAQTLREVLKRAQPLVTEQALTTDAQTVSGNRQPPAVATSPAQRRGSAGARRAQEASASRARVTMGA